MPFNYRHTQTKRTFFLAPAATTLHTAAHHSDQSDKQKRDSLQPAHTYIHRLVFPAALRPKASTFFLGFYITHNDAALSVGLLWTNNQLV
jgi:hypothetical protein